MDVELETKDGGILVRVQDDGAGFDPSSTGYGTGLQGIADRLDALGGTLEVATAPGDGTTPSASWTTSRSCATSGGTARPASA